MTDPIPPDGVLFQAGTGDVIGPDETGVTLRLSDHVIADLRLRLGLDDSADPDVPLGDIDAWDLRVRGDWLHFTANLEPGAGPRAYQRPLGGGDIIARAPGPLYALLSIGGARRAGFNDASPESRYNVLAPADHIGAVGFEGTGDATPTIGLQHIPHATRDTALADTLLAWRRAAMAGVPLFLCRAETDGAATMGALSQGRAYANLMAAVAGLVQTAAALGTSARVPAIGIDYGLEDCQSTPTELAEGLRALMRRIEADLNRHGLSRPIFLATFETGTPRIGTHPVMQAHWELAWCPGPHRLCFSAPAYMFEQTAFGRPTEGARLRMAEMDAHAVVALSARAPWSCPLLLLAEAEGRQIRVTAQAMVDLVLDPADPFGAGPTRGFALRGRAAPAIVSVTISPDDLRALILTCDGIVPATGITLTYAYGAEPDLSGRPANRGSLRDGWSAPSRHGGAPLHRWACSAALPVTGGQG